MTEKQPEYRWCTTSSVRCQNTNCLSKNVCNANEWDNQKPDADSVAVADRHNRYIGWPKYGTPFAVVTRESQIKQVSSNEHPPRRYCEGSPQECQNSICLSTNKCGLVCHSPGGVDITAKSISKADRINEKMGWPAAGTSYGS